LLWFARQFLVFISLVLDYPVVLAYEFG